VKDLKLCEGAQLQLCHKTNKNQLRALQAAEKLARPKVNKINVGFSPCGTLFKLLARNMALFSSLFSPREVLHWLRANGRVPHLRRSSTAVKVG
jgi:hypothetical protein